MGTRDQLNEVLAHNKRGAPLTDAFGDQLLREYLEANGETSYRKLAAKHSRSVGAVMRAIHSAVERAETAEKAKKRPSWRKD